MRQRALVLALAVVMAATLVTGTGAFSSAKIDRGATVHVTDDQYALLGVDATDVTVTGDMTDVDLLTLTNRDTEPLTTVDVVVTEANVSTPPALSNVTTIGSLGVGESGTVRADLACGAGTNSERVTLDVVASRQTLEIRLTRRIVIDCTA